MKGLNANAYKLLAGIIVLDLITVLSVRQAYNTDQMGFLVLAVLCIMSAAVLFMKLLDYGITAVMNVVWIGSSTVFVTIASALLFGEALSWKQALGMLIIIGGMLIIIGGIVLSGHAPKEEANPQAK